MVWKRCLLASLLLGVLVALSSCSFCGEEGVEGLGPQDCDEILSSSDDSGSGAGGTGILYVSNGNSSIVRFAGASALDGSVAPAAPPLQGTLTTLNNPRYLFLDASNNRLYVANFGGASVLVFDQISTLTGDIPPTRTVAGGNTTLNGPIQAVVDTTRDLLYVADSGTGSLLVFASASTVDGNVAPTRTIQGPNSGLTGISGMVLDSGNDRMYLSTGGPAIRVFNSVSTLVGDPFPNRTITGGNAELNTPGALALDSADNLYVVDNVGAILRFANASTIDGDTAPAANVSGGNTALSSPRQGLFDGTTGSFYVANSASAAMTVYASIATADLNIFPTRRLSGTATQLATPQGIALDTTR
ncbi:MAG: hypothetical protein HY319_31790 [Armatimonadetes bacterium]|nr:hypothetical protein [Armatimonadota bacterium]